MEIMSRLAIENYIIFGIILTSITVCFQIILLPFLFSELDAIQQEFDREIKQALNIFENSYQSLVALKPDAIRRERDAATKLVDDATSEEFSSRGLHVDSAPTFRAKTPLTTPRSKNRNAGRRTTPDFKRIAAEIANYEEYNDEFEYEDYGEGKGATSPLPPSPRSIPNGAKPPSPPSSHSTVIVNNVPICPLEENRCPPGPPGPPGQKGSAGLNGLDGNDGNVGLDAMDELTASYAVFCVTCPAGAEGKPGVPGIPGKPGLAGAPGITGPNGKNGQPGAPGGYGAPGKQGPMGSRGAPGSQGIDGVVLIPTRGPKGQVGKAGQAGQAGEEGTNNNQQGPLGMPGFPGGAGKIGENGLVGKRGETGIPGQAGENAVCKCEQMIKRAIDIAENTAYIALESSQPLPVGSEIRRTPSKIAIQNLPTLDELRRGNMEATKVTFAKQEDSHVKKFAVAPSEIEDNAEVLKPPSNNAMSAEIARPQKYYSPISTAVPLKSFARSTESTTTTSTEIAPTANSTTPPSTTEVTFTPMPEISTTESERKELINQSSPFKLHAATFVKTDIPKVIGESKKKGLNSKVKKSKGEGVTNQKNKMKKKKKVVRVKRIHNVKLSSNKEIKFSRDSEKVYNIENEIARDSETKKVSEIQKPISTKSTKVKKMKRVKLHPSQSLSRQHRENRNILENIAKSLGIISTPVRRDEPLKRIPIP